jgi:hypothetical protein
MGELVERILGSLKKYSAGFIVEQCCVVEHASIRTEMDPGGLIEDPRGLMGVQVQQVGEWVGIPHRPPSQNMQLAAKQLVLGQAGVS